MNTVKFMNEVINSTELRFDVELLSYSGRGMFGKECLGITGDFRDLLAVMIKAFDMNEEFFSVKNFLRVIRDNMGLNEVWYWPHIPWEEV